MATPCTVQPGFSYTVYPCAIDSSNQLPLAVDNQTPVNADYVNRHREAILAIESELGINPSSTYTTVRSRLDALEAGIGGFANVSVSKDGSEVVTVASTLNFTGGVSVTDGGSGVANITISSAGSIAIQDEGTIIESSASTINFIGADVLANSSSSGVVDVFIPSPDFASHWNTSDGSTGNQSVSESISRTVTRISSPSGGEGSPFKTNGWAGTNQDASINGTVVNTTPGDITGFGGDSNMVVNVYDADGVAVLETFTTPSITANGVFTSSSGRISVTITNYASDSLRFKARASVSTNIAGIFTASGLAGGRYHIEIVHNTNSSSDGTGPYTYVQDDVFYDTNPTTPVLTGVAISETAGSVVTKHLSGIEYYNLGSDFTINLSDIDQHNRNTSRVNASVLIRGAEYGLPNLDHSPFGTGSASFSGWTNNHDQDNISYQKTDWEITSANYRYIGPTGNVTGQVRDAWGSGSVINSSNANILIDTYGVTSSNLVENFDDESRRQDGYFNSGSTTGNWNSSNTLGVDSINSGNEAIVFNSRLMAPDQTTYIRSDGSNDPNTNWTGFEPNSGGANPDYTGVSVPVNYYRSFVDAAGSSRSSFTVVFTGTFVSNAAVDLANSDIEILLYKISGSGNTGAPPSNTTPLLLHGSNYNFATFDDGVTDGHVRLSSSSGNNIEGTFGGFNMQNGLFCHIRINNANIKIDSINFTFN